MSSGGVIPSSAVDGSAELGRVVVTHDPGYLELAGDWQGRGRELAGVWFIPPAKYGTVGAILRAMERQAVREGPPVRFL